MVSIRLGQTHNMDGKNLFQEVLIWPAYLFNDESTFHRAQRQEIHYQSQMFKQVEKSCLLASIKTTESTSTSLCLYSKEIILTQSRCEWKYPVTGHKNKTCRQGECVSCHWRVFRKATPWSTLWLIPGRKKVGTMVQEMPHHPWEATLKPFDLRWSVAEPLLLQRWKCVGAELEIYIFIKSKAVTINGAGRI